jgi:hypothetical protein
MKYQRKGEHTMFTNALIDPLSSNPALFWGMEEEG